MLKGIKQPSRLKKKIVDQISPVQKALIKKISKEYGIDEDIIEMELRQKQAAEELEEIEETEELEESLGSTSYISDSKRLENKGLLVLDGDITSYTIGPIIKKMLLMHYNDEFTDEIQLIINSAGGRLDIGWALIDIIGFVKNKVRTVAIGEICSMATMIFIAGDHRVMAPHSVAMVHQFSGLVSGNYSDFLASRKSQDISHDMFVKHFVEHSKYSSQEEIEKHLLQKNDNWLSPEEMLEHGLCDEVFRPINRRKKYKRKK